jgi:hypothetical protein
MASIVVRTWVASALGVAVLGALHAELYARGGECTRERVVRSAVWHTSMLAWPLFWTSMNTSGAGASVVGLVWPYVVAAIELLDDEQTHALDADGLTPAVEPTFMCSLTFALFGMLSAQGDVEHTRLFVTPIAMFLVASMPQRRSERNPFWDAVRHVTVAWSIGLIITAIFYRTPSLLTLPPRTARTTGRA